MNYQENGVIKMGFWGDRNNMNGKLEEIINIIHEDNKDIWISQLPLQEKGKYGSLQLMLSAKPSENSLEKLREMYSINLFQSEYETNDYKYLMVIEPLRFAYEEDWHHSSITGDVKPLSKEIIANRWDFDGYFYVTDAFNSYRKIAVIPFKRNTGFDSGHNLHKPEAEILVKNIVKRLNNGELFE